MKPTDITKDTMALKWDDVKTCPCCNAKWRARSGGTADKPNLQVLSSGDVAHDDRPVGFAGAAVIIAVSLAIIFIPIALVLTATTSVGHSHAMQVAEYAMSWLYMPTWARWVIGVVASLLVYTFGFGGTWRFFVKISSPPMDDGSMIFVAVTWPLWLVFAVAVYLLYRVGRSGAQLVEVIMGSDDDDKPKSRLADALVSGDGVKGP